MNMDQDHPQWQVQDIIPTGCLSNLCWLAARLLFLRSCLITPLCTPSHDPVLTHPHPWLDRISKELAEGGKTTTAIMRHSRAFDRTDRMEIFDLRNWQAWESCELTQQGMIANAYSVEKVSVSKKYQSERVAPASEAVRRGERWKNRET
jgi:hypothetical protein